ncbi:MAG: hypothetical protein KIT22_07790 [Verrucomicrobiae bacterium]|nr:hypothetical protein [Verrucomicrobiae bacterium]
MDIRPAATYRHRLVQETGPAITPQAPNRFVVLDATNRTVTAIRLGSKEEPVEWGRATFEDLFEPIAD